MGVGTPVPPYFLSYQDATTLPWFQLVGHPGPYDHVPGLSTQPNSYTLLGGYHVYAPGVGGTIDPFFTAGYDISTHGGIVPGYPVDFPRCDPNPGGPIHLTTNISVVSSQVSPLYLSQEVCRHSVWKTHWY